ncbi:hypothetical protein BDR05DRAFT_1048945 [Suillus weaverae]|nr:hypothetical protein BDR05DRAFT_1048945 [Suillus weaverae]
MHNKLQNTCIHFRESPSLQRLLVQDAQADLDAADSFQDACLKPLRVLEAVVGEITNIILAQVNCAAALLKLLVKLSEVYDFITQDEMLDQMKLAELYEIMDEPQKAMELVYQATPTPGTVPQPQGASLFEEKSRIKAKTPAPAKSRLSLAQLKVLEEQHKQEVILAYGTPVPRICGHDYDFKGKLPKRRIQQRDDTDEDRMASRLELNECDKHTHRAKDDGQPSKKVDSSHGVIFSRWLRVLMQRTLSAAVKTMSTTSTVFKKRWLDKEEPVFIGSSWRERFGQNCWTKGKPLEMLGSEDQYTPDHKPSQYPESKSLTFQECLLAWTPKQASHQLVFAVVGRRDNEENMKGGFGQDVRHGEELGYYSDFANILWYMVVK